ncbi:MAG: hypothetical protein ABSE62_17005 [Chthoniobacteraceae bacterium]|jgi:hypothetical protein
MLINAKIKEQTARIEALESSLRAAGKEVPARPDMPSLAYTKKGKALTEHADKLEALLGAGGGASGAPEIHGAPKVPGREGNDARDAEGHEYELKSVNVLLTQSFSTHHHMNPTIIAKYRLVKWCFAVYEGIELQEVYEMGAERLEPYFTKWEAKWKADGDRDVNNPKIPLTFVRQRGTQIFAATEPPVRVVPQSPESKPHDPEQPEG